MANAIRGVLVEELENSRRLLKRYQQAAAALPKGSIREKKIGNQRFAYLAYREGRRVRYEYKGKISAQEKAKYDEAKAMRAKYRGLMADLRKQIKFIERALHERRRRSR